VRKKGRGRRKIFRMEGGEERRSHGRD